MDSSPEYPKRTSHFAHKFVRLLSNCDATKELGPEACWLLAAIVHYEDFLRYTKPIAFHNSHLRTYCGFANEKALIRARRRAARAGWLHYERGAKRKPARYWVKIPDDVVDLLDTAPEHSDGLFSVEIDRETEPDNKNTLSKSTGVVGGKAAGKRRESGCPSSLSPSPSPSPEKRESANADAPAELLSLIDGWNEMGEKIVKTGNGARRDPPAKAVLNGWAKSRRERELRPVFQDIPKLLDAIRRARFCHGQDFFTLTWLFGKNRDGEWKAVKLINGGYDNANGNGTPHRTSLPTGAGHKHGTGKVDVSGF